MLCAWERDKVCSSISYSPHNTAKPWLTFTLR
jgi:hypothetical protein